MYRQVISHVRPQGHGRNKSSFAVKNPTFERGISSSTFSRDLEASPVSFKLNPNRRRSLLKRINKVCSGEFRLRSQK